MSSLRSPSHHKNTNDSTPSTSSESLYSSTMIKIKNKLKNNKHKQKAINSSISWCCFKVQKTLSPPTHPYPSPEHTKFVYPVTTNAKKQHSIYNKQQKSQENKPRSPLHTNSNINRRRTNDILLTRGYIKQQQISPTLQGEVFVAIKSGLHRESLLIYGYIRQIMIDSVDQINVISNICYMYYKQEVVIKRADKLLYSKGITITKTGMEVKVKEDIIKEAQLMAMFMDNNAPKSMIRYYDFMEDENSYYLVMEKGGKALFEFTVECHKWINIGKLSIKQWRKTVGFIFAEMVRFVYWMHNKVNCCNLDISLENIVIGNNTYFDENSGTINNLEIRFIDFGLTQLFDEKGNFLCNKYCGKPGYKSPQIYKRQPFMANKADIWSLGVCLFMMSIGAPPFKRPISTDSFFQFVEHNQMYQLLTKWNRQYYVSKTQYDLIMGMICIDETKRLSIDEVMSHIWLSQY